MRNVEAMKAVSLQYTALDILSPNGWNGAISTIAKIRCDGVIEVCYGLAGVSVWGAISTHYPVDTYLMEHQLLYGVDTSDPQLGLSPYMQAAGPCTRMTECSFYEPTIP